MATTANDRGARDTRPRNRLLAALPRTDYDRLAPDLKFLPTRPRQILQRAGEPIRHVFFPEGGVFSITTVLPEGMMVEATTVGDEGMCGVEAFFRDEPVAAGQTMMQVPDTGATRLSVEAFRREIATRG